MIRHLFTDVSATPVLMPGPPPCPLPLTGVVVALLAIGAAGIAGCDFNPRFVAASQQPVGRDPDHPLAGAWMGQCKGAWSADSWQVKAILGSKIPWYWPFPPPPPGPGDYVLDLYVDDPALHTGTEYHDVIRAAGERDGLTLLRAADVSAPVVEYYSGSNSPSLTLDGEAKDATLTLDYGRDAQIWYVVKLRRVRVR